MSKHWRFPSISGRRVAYTLHSDSMALWDSAYRATGALGCHFGWYDTLGDGMTQHAPEVAVTMAHAADYLASLASFVVGLVGAPRESDDDRELRDVSWCWPKIPSRAEIQFALSVKVKIGAPPRYFSLHDGGKVSAAASRQHDKRWHLIKEHHDGSVVGACAVLRADQGDSIHWGLERWVMLDAIHAVASEGDEWIPGITATATRHQDVDSQVPRLASGFEMAKQAFALVRAKLEAERLLWNHHERLKRETASEATL